MTKPFLLLLLTLSVASCAPRADLTPAPTANEVAALGEAAASTDAGVRVVASVDRWVGRPEDLNEVRPIWVEIENDSQIPLLVRYNAFALVGPAGERFVALPPFDIEATAAEPVAAPALPTTGFAVAPYASPFFPGATPFAGPFGFDSLYYRSYYPQFRRISLPTEDMVREALPEGVLDPGGRISGFLYFQPVNPELAQVVFTADLANAETGETFGSVRIPFVVE